MNVNHKQSLWSAIVIISVGLLLGLSNAHAGTNLSAKAGWGFFNGDFSGNEFAYGGEITFDVGGLVEFGGFFDNYSGFSVYGGLARLGFEGTLGFFADTKLGFSEGDFSWGVGIGKSSSLGVVALTPRIGYQSIGNNGLSGGVVDAALLITFKLP